MADIASVADIAERRPVSSPTLQSILLYQGLFIAGVYFLTNQNTTMTAYIAVFHFFLWKIVQAFTRA